MARLLHKQSEKEEPKIFPHSFDVLRRLKRNDALYAFVTIRTGKKYTEIEVSLKLFVLEEKPIMKHHLIDFSILWKTLSAEEKLF